MKKKLFSILATVLACMTFGLGCTGGGGASSESHSSNNQNGIEYTKQEAMLPAYVAETGLHIVNNGKVITALLFLPARIRLFCLPLRRLKTLSVMLRARIFPLWKMRA